jgi:hypothetical protein
MASQWGGLKEGDVWLDPNGRGLFSPTTSNPAQFAVSRGVKNTENTTPTADVSDPITPRKRVMKLSNVMVEAAFGDEGEKQD